MAKRDLNDTPERFNFFSRMFGRRQGDDEREAPIMDSPGAGGFFKLVGRNFNKIVSLNLMAVVGNFPLFFILLVMTGWFSVNSTAPTFTLFAQLNGAATHGGDAFLSAIMGSYSMQSSITLLSGTDYILLALACMMLLTFGPVNVGLTYICRNMVRQEPVFLMHDFFYSIKRNIKQSLLFGIADGVILVLMGYNLVFFNINFSQIMSMSIMFFATIFMAILYFFMRMYIYIMMLTFDLGIGKLLKNALLFSVLGVKRNACALVGTAAVVALNVFMLLVYFPIGVILPFVITVSLVTFLTVYCAYPVISKYMIEPYYKKDGTPIEENEE